MGTCCESARTVLTIISYDLDPAESVCLVAIIERGR